MVRCQLAVFSEHTTPTQTSDAAPSKHKSLTYAPAPMFVRADDDDVCFKVVVKPSVKLTVLLATHSARAGRACLERATITALVSANDRTHHPPTWLFEPVAETCQNTSSSVVPLSHTRFVLAPKTQEDQKQDRDHRARSKRLAKKKALEAARKKR